MLNFLSRRTMKSEKGGSKLPNFTIAGVVKFSFRLLQFVMALVVAGLYGQDLNKARKAGVYMDSKWMFAVVLAGMSAFSALLYMALVKFKTWYAFGWDAILWILYLALFGVFGKMYIKEDPEGNSGVQRMKNAVWVDLVNMFLWLITAVWGGIQFWRARKARTLLTGRGEEHP